MKKIITIIIVLAVIFTATFYTKNMMNDDIVPSYDKTQDVATTTGEVISSLPSYTEIIDVNYKKNTVPYTNSCLNITYKPDIRNGTNIIGPYSYPVELDFVGVVDDNLKINGKIVDGDKGIKSGSSCSHRHNLAYKTTIPANTPIIIELVDQHGTEVSLIGKLTITPITNKTYNLTLRYKVTDGYQGKVTPGGGKYTAGTTAVLTAEPINGFMVQWDGPCASELKTCKVLMNSDKTINVSFKQKPGWKCTLSFGSFSCKKEW